MSGPRTDEPATGTAPDEPAEEAVSLLGRVVEATGGSRREGQDRMAAAVAEAVADARHLLVQAGTGTGKSWGYLVPAVAAAVRRGRGVVVATSTLALQGQLVRHDLPRLADALEGPLGRRPTWQLVKGRNNYVCAHRLAGGSEAEEDPLSLWESEHTGSSARSELELQVARVREWAESTDTGDRDDLVPGVPERAWRAVSVTARECLGQRCPVIAECWSEAARNRAAWRAVSVTARECLGQRCPVIAECWSEAARNRARDVDVVVTNHAMLAIDATDNRKTLPQHDVVVVDEAHDLLDRVTAALSREVTVASAHATASAARRAGCAADDVVDLDRAADGLETALEQVQAGRLTDGAPPAVQDALLLLATAARSALRSLPKDAEAASKAQVARAALLEHADVAERIGGVPAPPGVYADDDDPQPEVAEAPAGVDVVWVEQDDRRGTVLKAAPLDVSGLLRTRLFDARTVVATSATLTGPGGFDALARRMGLGRGGWTGLDVGSPFDYGRQAILYVAAHLPPPGRDGHGDPLHDELVALVEAAGGRTLGLFSSRRAATAAAEVVRARTDLPVLCQGEDTVPTLVKRFAADPRTCLFGTLGLWQGVDVPGASCSLVVLDRVPFPRPDDPLSQARSEAVDRAGGSGFMQVSVAHAATLLAQGAGRLVRSSDDRGVVALLDSRVATKRYGPALLQALPPFWRTTDRAVVLAALSRLPR